MRAGNLQPVRLQIVDQKLAEAVFLAQLLLGAERRAAGVVFVIAGLGRCE
jgi:hypothetical protein